MILSQNSNNSYSSGLLSDIILIVNLPSFQEPEHYFLLYPTGTFSEFAVHFFAVLLRCWFTKHKMKVEQTYKVENKLFRVLEIWDFIRYKVRIYNKTVMCYVKYYIVQIYVVVFKFLLMGNIDFVLHLPEQFDVVLPAVLIFVELFNHI